MCFQPSHRCTGVSSHHLSSFVARIDKQPDELLQHIVFLLHSAVAVPGPLVCCRSHVTVSWPVFWTNTQGLHCSCSAVTHISLSNPAFGVQLALHTQAFAFSICWVGRLPLCKPCRRVLVSCCLCCIACAPGTYMYAHCVCCVMCATHLLLAALPVAHIQCIGDYGPVLWTAGLVLLLDPAMPPACTSCSCKRVKQTKRSSQSRLEQRA